MMATSKHADLAQDENTDQIDRVVASAEPAEMENALLGDNPADQDGDQRYDRNGLKADTIELIDQRCRPQPSRIAQHPKQRVAQRAEHRDKRDEIAAGARRRPTQRFDRCETRLFFRRGRDCRSVGAIDGHQQSAHAFGHVGDGQFVADRIAPSNQSIQQTRAEGVDIAERLHINR